MDHDKIGRLGFTLIMYSIAGGTVMEATVYEQCEECEVAVEEDHQALLQGRSGSILGTGFECKMPLRAANHAKGRFVLRGV